MGGRGDVEKTLTGREEDTETRSEKIDGEMRR